MADRPAGTRSSLGGARPKANFTDPAVGAQAIGNTRLAVVVDGLGRTVGLNLVPGNRHDLRAVTPLTQKLAGRLAIADRGFDTKQFRDELIRLDATPCIRSPFKNHIQYHYSKPAYSLRHVV